MKGAYVQQEIEDIASSIETKFQYLCNFYFKDVTTFGFLGDRIVEAANSGLKYGRVKVSRKMIVNNSRSAQLKITENQAQRKTSKFILRYNVIIACNCFDQRIVYNVRRYNFKMWSVLKKKAGTKPTSLDKSYKLYFDRVRYRVD